MVTVQPRPCTACRSLVYDLKYVDSQKLAPIDANAAENGNILIDLERGVYSILGPVERRVCKTPLHINHFATCPAANKFRKQKEVTNGKTG